MKRKSILDAADAAVETDVYAGAAAQAYAVSGGWSAARYHGDDGESVAEFLSFKSVYSINPFEVGASHAAERRRYRATRGCVFGTLDIKPLLRRRFSALSNGEMRRVLLARELLAGAKRVVVRDPFGGLDAEWRRRMDEAVAKLGAVGIELVLEGTPAGNVGGAPSAGRRRAVDPSAKTVMEMRGVNIAFGNRVLFKDFGWTVREGERWLLRGPNGSGKTTLLDIIAGDAPVGYAFDIRLFGRRRGDEGVAMADVRRKIAVVSSLREMYEGTPPEAQLDNALSGRTRLLLLDEPCCDLAPKAAHKFLDRIGAWLDAHPRAAAICVAHCAAHVPPGFTRVQTLPQQGL